jgi:hypothetical protein
VNSPCKVSASSPNASCTWFKLGNLVYCATGYHDNRCYRARFAPYESQSDRMRVLTERVNALIADIVGDDPSVAILDVNGELVFHEIAIDANIVTPEDDPATITQAFGAVTQ